MELKVASFTSFLTTSFGTGIHSMELKEVKNPRIISKIMKATRIHSMELKETETTITPPSIPRKHRIHSMELKDVLRFGVGVEEEQESIQWN